MHCTPLLIITAVLCRALVNAMAEILWFIGGKNKCVLAVLNIFIPLSKDISKEGEQDEVCIGLRI